MTPSKVAAIGPPPGRPGRATCWGTRTRWPGREGGWVRGMGGREAGVCGEVGKGGGGEWGGGRWGGDGGDGGDGGEWESGCGVPWLAASDNHAQEGGRFAWLSRKSGPTTAPVLTPVLMPVLVPVLD